MGRINLQFFGARGASSGKKTSSKKQSPQTQENSNLSTVINVSDSVVSNVKDLEAMAKAGVIPRKIEGNREEQSEILETINRLYPSPPGIMNQYTIENHGNSIDIHFTYDSVRGEDTGIRLPKGKKASQTEIEGAIKYAIYKHRGPLELAALSRGLHGYANLEMGQKWGGRLLSDAEKTQANKDMERHIIKLFNSPLSTEGRELNNGYWFKEIGGWRRLK